jgi:hypothetical protein
VAVSASLLGITLETVCMWWISARRFAATWQIAETEKTNADMLCTDIQKCLSGVSGAHCRLWFIIPDTGSNKPDTRSIIEMNARVLNGSLLRVVFMISLLSS